MEITKTLYVTNRNNWRIWLEKNHAKKKEIWLIYYKKHTGKPTIPYNDAVEEALCFGWIDTTVKKIDDEKYAQKFTPRKDKSKWSETNKIIARKMIREKRMTKAGLEKFKKRIEYDKKMLELKSLKKFIIPSDLKKDLIKNKKAWKNFNNFAPGYKKQYIGWITDAKKEETREKRIKQTIRQAAQNKKLAMK